MLRSGTAQLLLVPKLPWQLKQVKDREEAEEELMLGSEWQREMLYALLIREQKVHELMALEK